MKILALLALVCFFVLLSMSEAKLPFIIMASMMINSKNHTIKKPLMMKEDEDDVQSSLMT